MFSIYLLDSSKLFQWDLNRKIKIIGKEEVDEVHFSHAGDEEALVVKPIKENNILIANIPNILLQEHKDIFVYLVSKDKTLKETFFTVGRREKPTDYLYTEIDILNYSSLEKRLVELEEKLKNVLVEETDPTVPDWAKQPDKPRYTAAEVGALSSTETVRQLAQKQDKSKLVTSINASSVDSTYPSTRAVYEYVGEELARLVGSAPDALNTIEELANAFSNNQDVLDALNASIINKQDKADSVGIKTTQGGEIFNNYNNNIANALYAHAEGESTESSGVASHSEGGSTKATGDYSHAEGCNAEYSDQNTTASGIGSHAEGRSTQATGDGSHAEGESTVASGWTAHAEGRDTRATASSSHAEGLQSQATNGSAHAEGYDTRATGDCSHSEGNQTQANGSSSHAEGLQTRANGKYQHVEGKFNIPDNENKYAHIVGNGEEENSRSNAHTLDWEGNAWFKGGVYVGGTSQEDATLLSGESNVQADWDQTDETSSDFIKNKPFYILPDESIFDSDITMTSSEDFVEYYFSPTLPIVDGERVFLVFNNDCQLELTCGELSELSEDCFKKVGYFAMITSNRLYIRWYASEQYHLQVIKKGVIKQLDEKYIPDTIARTEDIESNFLSFTNPQELSDEQKAQVRENIGFEEIEGTQGVGIESIEQTTTSTEDGGENVVTVTLTDDTTAEFTIRNGSKGSSGVYVGSGDMPDDYNVQIDPDEEYGGSIGYEHLDDELKEKIASSGGEVDANAILEQGGIVNLNKVTTVAIISNGAYSAFKYMLDAPIRGNFFVEAGLPSMYWYVYGADGKRVNYKLLGGSPRRVELRDDLDSGGDTVFLNVYFDSGLIKKIKYQVSTNTFEETVLAYGKAQVDYYIECAINELKEEITPATKKYVDDLFNSIINGNEVAY